MHQVTTEISCVVKFTLDFSAHFEGFEGGCYVYLAEKRMKWAKKDGVMMAKFVQWVHRYIYEAITEKLRTFP